MRKTKKQVRVRTKKGKTYMRSMMVNSGSAEAISRRATQVSLKQDSAKPNKPGLISRLFFRGGKNQSRSALAAMNHDGPNAGSDHSWIALAVGALKDRSLVSLEREGDQREAPWRSGSPEHAQARREAANTAGRVTPDWIPSPNMGRYARGAVRLTVADAFGVDRFVAHPYPTSVVGRDLEDSDGYGVVHAPHNPNKWVR